MSGISATPALKQRKPGVDALRLLAALSVITLHLDPIHHLRPEILHPLMSCARYAVPFFFMVTGFFMGTREEILEKSPKALARLAFIFLLSSLLYIPFQIGRDGMAVLQEFINFAVLARGTCYHLWFLSSLFFAILVIFLLARTGKEKWLWPFSCVLLVWYLWANHFQRMLDEQIFFVRYLSGIPLLHIGMALRRWKSTPLVWWLPVGTMVAFVLQYQEVKFSEKLLGVDPAYFQCTIAALCCAAGLLLTANALLASSLLVRLGDLGRRYSLGIYILHIWFITLVKKTYALCGIIGLEWSTLIMAPIVFVLTLAALMAFDQTVKIIGTIRARVMQSSEG